ncbi:MAG: peptide MFS transporter [Phocaeicola sp.]
MFKKHPKGLLCVSYATMGERFGFYTMMAVLVLFLQSKFRLTGTEAGLVYATFYFLTYVLAFVGGLIADKTKNFVGTITVGIILMATGYISIAIPTQTPVLNPTLSLILCCISLFTIAFGNGLFKGNVQAVIGQMYDNKEYADLRDEGYTIYYVFLSLGSTLAPMVAIMARNYWIGINNLGHNEELSGLCNRYLDSNITPEAVTKLQELANQVSGKVITDLTAFSYDYLDIFTKGFNFAFAFAVIAMLISLTLFLKKKSNLPRMNATVKSSSSDCVELSSKETKQRILALLGVFASVVFFWFAFHQNGLSLTLFAKDYTKVFFGGHHIHVEEFQSLEPFFLILITPIVLKMFQWLKRRNLEPSTPKKMIIGLGFTSLAFVVLALGSLHLPLLSEVTAMGSLSEDLRVTPFFLIGCYLLLAFGELFISPLGMSFVSKVSPKKYQGVMQGGWLGATSVGNELLFIGAIAYEHIPIWMTWAMFSILCLVSIGMMYSMLKFLEKFSK